MAINWRISRLEAGKLRHRIDIVKVSGAQDSTGGVNFSACLVYAKVWAAVEALDGATESLMAGSEVSVVPWQVTIRYIFGAPAWQPSFSYPTSALIKDPSGYLQQAQGQIVSGANVPTWNETEGGFTSDGDPSLGGTWLNLGTTPPYTGVTSAMQIWWQGRQFQIKNVVNPDGRNKMLALMCVEINDSRQQLTMQPGGLN